MKIVAQESKRYGRKVLVGRRLVFLSGDFHQIFHSIDVDRSPYVGSTLNSRVAHG